MEWRVIPLETMDAFKSMALDEACCNYVSGGGKPTIRFWRWSPSAVSIGYFQKIADEVNLAKCESSGVSVVRRRTGGGAVYHDFNGEITYSVVCPESMVHKGITESYKIICDWVVKGLGNLGIESNFKPINDIIAGEKKISGNAQTRRNNILHQHGTILYDLDVEKMFSLLKVSEEKISDKMIESVKERVTSVMDFRDISFQGTYMALLQGFTDGKDWKFGEWTAEELKKAELLAREKYNTMEWNFLR